MNTKKLKHNPVVVSYNRNLAPVRYHYTIESFFVYKDGHVKPRTIMRDDILTEKSSRDALNTWRNNQKNAWHKDIWSKRFFKIRLSNGKVVNLNHVFDLHGNSSGPRQLKYKNKGDKRLKVNQPKFESIFSNAELRQSRDEFKSRIKYLREIQRVKLAERKRRRLLKTAVIINPPKFSLLFNKL